jgi:biofilm PGA synthesis lipoprotein PgaB
MGEAFRKQLGRHGWRGRHGQLGWLGSHGRRGQPGRLGAHDRRGWPGWLTALTAVAAAILVLAAGRAAAANSAVILQYEQIGDPVADGPSVTLEQFDQHLGYLAEHNFVVWPAEKIVAHVRNGLALPDHCVAITFDGAYTSVYEQAFPRLLERGWPFSVFISTESIDLQDPGFMSWGDVREMRKAGVKFGNLSNSRTNLTRRQPGELEEEWRARVVEDIRYCRGRLFEQLSQATDLLAYPGGMYDPQLREIVLSLKLSGLGLHPGPAWPGSDLGAVPRFALSRENASLEEFIARVQSLPLPVQAVEPVSPVIPSETEPPVLRLTLAPGDYQADALTGSLENVGGHQDDAPADSLQSPGDLILRWVDREKGVLEAVAREPLLPGLSAYTIVVPNADGSRFYWFSHPWVHAE